jgi:endonuclease YncB( thermonuclease family)
VLLAGLLLLRAGPAAACVPPGPKEDRLAAKIPMRARVTAVTDGDTLTLETGAALRLVGLQAPKLALGRPGYSDWPFAAEAKAALEVLTLGKMLSLHPGSTPFDRYGRILAQAYIDAAPAPVWLQGALLDQGTARVYSFKDNRGCVAELLARERIARAAGRGLWALPAYAVRPADAVSAADAGRFVVVEGRVHGVGDFKDKAYLNFGPNYRTDFTGVIADADLALFRAEGYDLKGLRGQPIRVRGWLEMLNGPMIALSHPEQIEKLDGVPGGGEEEDR